MLDGRSPYYFHLYLLREGKVIGMLVSKEVKGLGGWVVMHYIPPLVLKENAKAIYVNMLEPKVNGVPRFIGVWADMTLFQILTGFGLIHLRHPDRELKAEFTDDIGTDLEQLTKKHYYRGL